MHPVDLCTILFEKKIIVKGLIIYIEVDMDMGKGNN